MATVSRMVVRASQRCGMGSISGELVAVRQTMRGLAVLPKQGNSVEVDPDVEKANEKRVAAAADDNEPEGTTPEGHGFDDQAGTAHKRFSGEGKTYGKIQEDHAHVASKAQGLNPGIAGKDESLEGTGYDTSKRTTPGGDE